MDISLSKQVIEVLGAEKLKPFGLSEDSYRWRDGLNIDLSSLTRAKTEQLRKLLLMAGKVRGAQPRVQDIDRWLEILDSTSTVRCKKIADFGAMLKQYLKGAPKHWIYQARENSEVWQPYYVGGISYTPPKRDRYEGYIRAYVTVTVYWEELGVQQKDTIDFYDDDCEGLTVPKALALKGYTIESPETLAAYLANRKRYIAIHDKVGLQFLASGWGLEEEEESRSWWRRHSQIRLDRDGVKAHVVVDVLHEGEEERRSKSSKGVDTKFWMREGCDHEGDPEDNDDIIEPGDEDSDDPAEHVIADIPLSPSLMCFDLKRHTRLKIYVDQLEDYVYQTDLSTKLILPDEVTSLVDMLVRHRGGFKDIVGGKGGGAIILCAGPPGTGKTLTSEVYSESMNRPLYSVQCSQLGTDPDALEKQLLMVFSRAQRWNAILLLDEADVYVAQRGRDLIQNAIVGVFLRVLEYYAGVLFLTTNRADLVDDAVLSRCLARIDYTIPTPEDQVRIWRTLADVSGVQITDRSILEIVQNHNALSGRDIKNLLKLASMVVAANGADLVTPSVVDFVKRFKPTADIGRHPS